MKMRYKKSVGIFLILLGVLEVCVYLLIGIGSSPVSLPILGFVVILFGVLFLQRTYFMVNADSLVFHALLGSAKRTYKFLSLKELGIENNNIFMTIDGKRKKSFRDGGLRRTTGRHFCKKSIVRLPHSDSASEPSRSTIFLPASVAYFGDMGHQSIAEAKQQVH